MKKYLNLSKSNLLQYIGIAVGIGIMFSSCTKYVNPPAHYEEYELEGNQQVKRKVLFISIDGLVGKELKKEIPTHLAELLKTSKYTFESIADEKSNDATTWMSMMTGVPSDKHRVEDNTFIPKPDENDPHANITGYPSMLYRIATTAPTLKSYVIARDQEINTRLLMSADETFDASSDEEVKNQVIEVLSKKNGDLTIVQFKDVLDAGLEVGFSAEKEAYANAIKTVDKYIGEITKAVQERKNYLTEDWLIILTSNHGGDGNRYGGASLLERNTFSIFHNKAFLPLEFKSDVMTSMRFFGFNDVDQANYEYFSPQAFRARNKPVLSGESVYDIAPTGEITVEAKIKMNPTNGTFNYATTAPFLGKNASRYGSTPGWAFFKLGNELSFFVADGSVNMGPVAKGVSTNGEWAHITGVFSKVNNVPTVKIYLNGVKAEEQTNKDFNPSKSLSPTGLTFGYFPYVFNGRPADLQMCDIHIYNKALDEESIKKNANRVGIPDGELNHPNLVGYWPMDQLSNNQFINKISGKPNIAAQGTSKFTFTANTLPYVDPSTVLIQSEDMFTQIFYWLEVRTQKEWNLTGQVFLNKYEIEFLTKKEDSNK